MGVRLINFRVLSRLLILLVLLTVGLTQAVQAQSDTNGDPDIFLPGIASMDDNTSGEGGFGFAHQSATNLGAQSGILIYTLKNTVSVQNLHNALLPVGLDISGTGAVAIENNSSIEAHLPDQYYLPEVSVLPIESGSAKLLTSQDKAVATGSFVVKANLKDLKDKKLSLVLSKYEQTGYGQVSLCLGNLEGTSAEELEAWIENGLHGAPCQMFNNGELDLDLLVVSAFKSHPELDTIGIMQVGVNATSQEVIQKAFIIARKVKDDLTGNTEIELEVKTVTE